MSDVNCPYCDAEIEICHDDGYGYEEGELHEQYCSNCDKNFAYTTSIIFHYESYQADCLNNGKHHWKPQTTFPKECTKMECQTCGDIREPSESEMKEITSETVS